MKLVNLTPHEITIHPTVGAPIVLPPPPKGEEVRLVGGPTPDVRTFKTEDGETIRVVLPPSYAAIEGVPPYDSDTALVVSAMVGAQAPALLGNKWQGRVYGPDTGKDAIRNEAGHISAVKGLILYW